MCFLFILGGWKLIDGLSTSDTVKGPINTSWMLSANGLMATIPLSYILRRAQSRWDTFEVHTCFASIALKHVFPFIATNEAKSSQILFIIQVEHPTAENSRYT
eukprot:m.30605 g.30605  ORF g.30605 m.30605 type:complete len:103 (+) comp9303_c0_seq1:1808-2116(+)